MLVGATASSTAEFTWHAHPASERTGPAVLGLVVILGLAAAILASFGSLAWSGLAVVFLVVSLNRFYFRSRFHVDDEGITARFPLRTRRLLWRDVRRFAVDEHGGYLSTRANRSWLDAYRGLHLLFGTQRDAVIEQVRSHLPERDDA